MRFAISLFILIVILGTSAKQQASPNKITYCYVKKPLVRENKLIKPTEELLKALKELESKSHKCNSAVNKILKSQKDSLSLIANKDQ